MSSLAAVVADASRTFGSASFLKCFHNAQASFSLHYVLSLPHSKNLRFVNREVQSRAGFRLHKGRHAEGSRDPERMAELGPEVYGLL